MLSLLMGISANVCLVSHFLNRTHQSKIYKKMDKTLFKVPKMDCPAEENLIRMKLENISSVYDMNSHCHGSSMSNFSH